MPPSKDITELSDDSDERPVVPARSEASAAKTKAKKSDVTPGKPAVDAPVAASGANEAAMREKPVADDDKSKPAPSKSPKMKEVGSKKPAAAKAKIATKDAESAEPDGSSGPDVDLQPQEPPSSGIEADSDLTPSAKKKPATAKAKSGAKAKASMKRPAGKPVTTPLKVHKYLYHKQQKWGCKVNGKEYLTIKHDDEVSPELHMEVAEHCRRELEKGITKEEVKELAAMLMAQAKAKKKIIGTAAGAARAADPAAEGHSAAAEAEPPALEDGTVASSSGAAPSAERPAMEDDAPMEGGEEEELDDDNEM